MNRCAVFVDDVDRGNYLHLLAEQLLAHDVAMHAYVPMANHAHLLLSSQAEGSISRVMRNAVRACSRGFT